MEGSARHALMLPTALAAPSLCLMTTTGTLPLIQTLLSAAPTPLHAGQYQSLGILHALFALWVPQRRHITCLIQSVICHITLTEGVCRPMYEMCGSMYIQNAVQCKADE